MTNSIPSILYITVALILSFQFGPLLFTFFKNKSIAPPLNINLHNNMKNNADIHNIGSTSCNGTPFCVGKLLHGTENRARPVASSHDETVVRRNRGNYNGYGFSFFERSLRSAPFRRASRASMDARFYNGTRLIVVDQNGFGHFQTIQAAVDSIPSNNTFSYTIYVAGGIFEEKVIIPKNKPFIKIQGLGSDTTVIRWHDTAATFGSGLPNRPLGTFRSATFAVNSPNFVARGITFQNTAPPPVEGAAGGQAVALQVSGDQAAFYECNFLGRQDTLYDHRGRHYFRNCYIEGSVDFIFGDGLSLYKECEIHAVGSGFITAQKRQNSSEETGFSFLDCSITGANSDSNSSILELYLGRAWGPYSRVVYSSCYMDDIIAPEGWNSWDADSSRESTVYYSEFNSTGPGAKVFERVPWSHQLNETEAAPFMDISFIQGDEWLPYL